MRAVVGVGALGLLGGVVALVFAITPSPAHDTSTEDARARAWLETTAPKAMPRCLGAPAPLAGSTMLCFLDGHTDVDGDGRADCWQLTVHPHRDYASPELVVWPGCRGDGVHIQVDTEGMTKVAVPPALATEPWLRFVATRFVDRVVMADAPNVDPAWRWVLASAARTSTDRRGDGEDRRWSAWDGAIAPSWQPMPVTAFAPSALAMRAAPPRWLWHLGGGGGDLEEELHQRDASAWLVFDAGAPSTAERITCGELEIRADRGGVIAIDATRQRWTWLFRGLADFREFDVAKLACIDGDVIAATSGSFARLAVIDPHTGGWLFEPATDAGRGAWLWRAPTGDYIWTRDANPAVPFAALRGWLGTPPATRGTLDSVAAAARPELTPELRDTWSVAAVPAETTTLPGAFEPRPIAAAQLRGQIPFGPCAGWEITASPTAAIATRGLKQRWIDIEPTMTPMRITNMRCEQGHIILSRAATGDLMDTSTSSKREDLVIDLAHETWTLVVN